MAKRTCLFNCEIIKGNTKIETDERKLRFEILDFRFNLDTYYGDDYIIKLEIRK